MTAPDYMLLKLSYQIVYSGSCYYLLPPLPNPRHTHTLLPELLLSTVVSERQKFPRWGLEDLEVSCPVGWGRGERVPPTRGARSASSLAADCWLHVRLFYGAELVREATARTAEGCSLSPRAAAAAAERLLGPPRRMAQVRFPEPPPGARVLQRLLPHLERGVLLWVAPEGVFAKRLCQGRVYWRGPLAPHRAQPNKLERERTCQLLDTRRFLAGKSKTVGPLVARGRVTGHKGGQRDVDRGEWAHEMWTQGNRIKDAGHGVGIEIKDMTQNMGSGNEHGHEGWAQIWT